MGRISMFELRPALPSDLAELAELEALCFDKPWRPSQLASLTASYPPDGIVEEFALVLTENQKIIAYIGWQRVFGDADLLSVAVHPDKRRQGLARKLFLASEPRLKKAGVRQFHLEVSENNTAAKALYEQLGFEDYGERKDYYGAGEAARLMRRVLE